MYIVVWQPKHGGGGHQVALTLDRAETVQRAVSQAMPGADVRIEPVDGYAPPDEAPRELSRERWRAGSVRRRGTGVRRL